MKETWYVSEKGLGAFKKHKSFVFIAWREKDKHSPHPVTIQSKDEVKEQK